jgi:hypothetical protein
MGEGSPCLATMETTTMAMGAQLTAKLRLDGFAPEDRQTPKIFALRQFQEPSPSLQLGNRISSVR